jgi:hypothetical protein
MTHTTSDHLEVAASKNRILKQPYKIAGKSIIVLDEFLIKKLGIDEDVWFEQIAMEGGILLKIIDLNAQKSYPQKCR